MKLAAAILLIVPCVFADLPNGLQPYPGNVQSTTVKFAIKSINEKYNDGIQRQVVELISSQYQLVQGFKYYYTLKVSGGPQIEICRVTVWNDVRPEGHWDLKLDGDPFCRPESSCLNVGQPTPVDFNDPGVQAAFKDLQARVNVMNNGLELLKGQKTQNITKQVVAGSKYVFTDVPFYKTSCDKTDSIDTCAIPNGAKLVSSCSGEVYVPPNGPSTMSNVVCSNPSSNEEIDPPLSGAPTPIIVAKDDTRITYAVDAINKYFKGQGDNFVRSLKDIISAAQQITTGVRFFFTLRMSAGSTDEECRVQILFQPWLEIPELYTMSGRPSCVPMDESVPVPGAPFPNTIAKDDDKVVFAVGAINKYFKDQGDNLVRSVQEVISATSQVASGVKWTFSLKMSGGASEEKCEVSILIRPWISKQPQLMGSPSCVAL